MENKDSPPKRQPASVSHQEAFIDRHIQIVEPMARKLARQLHIPHEVEDVIASGRLGLVRAAATYNPAKGGRERFWAWSCIRLEILNRHRDARIWAWRGRPLTETMAAPPLSARAEPDPLPINSLPQLEQKVLRLLYEEGLSEHAICRRHLLGRAPHHNENKRKVPIGWRRVRRIRDSALRHLKDTLSDRPAA